MCGAAAGAEIERHDQRRAATDAMAFDRGDGDLVHVLPGLAHLGPEPLALDALADRQAVARAPFRIFQVETGAKRLGGTREDHDRGFEIVLEVARHVAQLAHRLLAERIDVVAAIEAHDGDAALRAEAFLYLHELALHRRIPPVFAPR